MSTRPAGHKKTTKKAPARKKAAAKKAAAKKPAAKKPAGRYTKPALRERLKKKVQAGSKGGRAGQWSARKAQLLAQAYKAEGGGYKGGQKKTQKSLSAWTRQDWQTSDGKRARGKTSTRRYLPKEAWEKLTPAERRATDRNKQAAGTKKQTVANTAAAKQAGAQARKKKAASGGTKAATKKRGTRAGRKTSTGSAGKAGGTRKASTRKKTSTAGTKRSTTRT